MISVAQCLLVIVALSLAELLDDSSDKSIAHAGFGVAAIDGEIHSGEWAYAARSVYAISAREGRSGGFAVAYVMHDRESWYVGIVADNGLLSERRVAVRLRYAGRVTEIDAELHSSIRGQTERLDSIEMMHPMHSTLIEALKLGRRPLVNVQVLVNTCHMPGRCVSIMRPFNPPREFIVRVTP